jgi:hypothetical protein
MRHDLRPVITTANYLERPQLDRSIASLL